ncbi:MAG: orotidine-5'-phosphate decarboxylase [Brevinematales bacterium]|jgi:orotidine-5'-phosphate decarboxylase
MNFADKLLEASKEKNSALVAGLDPDLNCFPDFLKQEIHNESYQDIEESIFYFNKIVIDSISDFALAVKPQFAFYELYGSYGIRALEKTIQYAKSKGLFVINDAKRGDIDSTSLAYARAHLGNGPISSDMVTVNPFLGKDGYNPFIKIAKENNRGLFLLLKTSSPSAGEIQDLKLIDGRMVYQKMASTFSELTKTTLGDNNYSFIGFVVSATYPSVGKEIRELLPNSIFLVPGLGFQGGKAEDLQVFFDKNGNGAVISSSRGITYAYMKEKENWESISENEMKSYIRNRALKDYLDINKVRIMTRG